MAMPSPGTARPSHFETSGSVMPSMKRKIQTSAATLMMSGTVTTSPVMKRRRSQAHIASARIGGGRDRGEALVRGLRRGREPGSSRPDAAPHGFEGSHGVAGAAPGRLTTKSGRQLRRRARCGRAYGDAPAPPQRAWPPG